MPADWSADHATRTIGIRAAGDLVEADCLALIRGVAMVTNILPGFTIRVDARELHALPDYPALVRIAHEIAAVRAEPLAHIALHTAPHGAALARLRQLCAILESLGVDARLVLDGQPAHTACPLRS